MQGWRISMEDAHAAILDLNRHLNPNADPAPKESRLSFFGVYDGHGGEKVAEYSGAHVHEIIGRQKAFTEGNYEQALKDGFLATDRALLQGRKSCERKEGSNADVALCRSSVQGGVFRMYCHGCPHHPR